MVMKSFIRTAATFCLAAVIVVTASAAAAEELCPMGGTLIDIAVDKDKALEWLEDERRAFLLEEEDDLWTITTLSDASDKIAVVMTEGFVFFGVADDRDDREADENRMEKAFGNDFKFLRNAVQKDIKAMWKAQIIDIEGGDVAKIEKAVGLGVLSGERGDWSLTDEDCQAMTVNVDELD